MSMTEERARERAKEIEAWRTRHPVKAKLTAYAIVAPFVAIPGLIIWHETTQGNALPAIIGYGCCLFAAWQTHRKIGTHTPK